MRYFIVSTFLGVMTFSLQVHAQTDSENAGDVFREAVKAYDANQFVEAASLFRKANAIKFNWKLLYNIGQCEAAAKRNGLALQAFEEYMTRAGDDITVARREEVMAEIRRLKLIVGMLEVDAPAGAMVMVDGEFRDRIPLVGPIMISSGIPHEVVVIFDDEEILRQNVRVSGGNTQQITATTAALETTSPSTDNVSDQTETESQLSGSSQKPASTPDEMKDKRSSAITPLGPVLMGVGVAIVGAGLTTGIMAYRKGTELEDRYSNGVPETEAEKVDQVDHLALAADILIPAGAATAIAGVLIWMVQRNRATPGHTPVPAALITPNGLGVGFSGRF